MNATKIISTRGRPRAFDKEEALAKAQALFHAKGYDALSVADLTEAIGINPPSFYAAFGSKAELYGAALKRYEEKEGLDISGALAPDRPLDEGVTTLLRQAADNYGSGAAPGCMVIEGARGTADQQACSQARRMLDMSRAVIHAAIAGREPERAELITDYIMMTMAGLSASARNGVPTERLRAIAAIASTQLSHHIEGIAPKGTKQ
ncbi:TetR/AcrR family transcriptional regulator [Neorhizobium galegae]|uniref:TetR/AcrR family transcriptional regulator n=1 Tax=Neorhizobium galegae TaxID=399 RepID=UPI002101C54E|nr:TetR/AcrR family transcriptional regulator [Neorhizobium galegae]MCQ1572938.1 TetR/AcrR family transcriptional regulator [Neorhizobium galegae]